VWEILDVGWSHDGTWIATASGDSTARIWDAQTGQLRFTLSEHTGIVSAVDWSPDSSRMVTGSEDGTAKVWEITDGGTRELLLLTAHEMRNGVPGVAFSPDGNRVMGGNLANTAVRVWDVSMSGGGEWATLPGARSRRTSAAFTPDGRRLVASGRGGTVIVADPDTGRTSVESASSPARPDSSRIAGVPPAPD